MVTRLIFRFSSILWQSNETMNLREDILMAKYNFYISYASKDRESAGNVAQGLTEKGYSVAYDLEISPGSDWTEQLADAISNSDCFVPVITDNFLASRVAQNELSYAITKSAQRGQKIFPLIFTEKEMPIGMRFQLSSLQQFVIRNPEDEEKALEQIHRNVEYRIKSAALYEKLTEYRKLNHHYKAAETVCLLLDMLVRRWPDLLQREKRAVCQEICSLMEQLSVYAGPYGEEAKTIGRRIVQTAANVDGLLQSGDDYLDDLYFSAFAVQLKYWYWEVRTNGLDLIYSGDVFQGIIDPCPIQKGIERQRPYIDAFLGKYTSAVDNGMLVQYTQKEREFIEKTSEYILSEERNGITPLRPAAGTTAAVTEDEELLLSIAKFMQEGNKLFDILQKRGVAGDFMKCLLTSYERLKNYCQVVGAADVAAACVDRIVDIRSQLDKQKEEKTTNAKAEDGIKSLLGFTLKGSGSYDVFISFKSEDSDMAEKIYQLCQRHMKVPFWSKRTLPELSQSEYEDAIYDAIRKAKHFVVVLSKLEYLEAGWIKREMKAFDRAITEGRKPNGNFVFVATDDVYDQIIGCNKMCLDERYCGYQILKMSEYENNLMPYIN